jgi:hypothetical protein
MINFSHQTHAVVMDFEEKKFLVTSASTAGFCEIQLNLTCKKVHDRCILLAQYRFKSVTRAFLCPNLMIPALVRVPKLPNAKI